MKMILQVDMDGVLVDLADQINRLPSDVRERYGNDVDEVPGLFDDPPPIPGAIEALKRLADSGRFDIHILSTAPWGNPGAWTAKRHWIERHFGEMFQKRITLTHRKDRIVGDFLIDDRPNNGAEDFLGEWIQFGTSPFDSWKEIVKYLLANGFYWLGSLGAKDSEAKLRDALIHSWLNNSGPQGAELPSPLDDFVLSFHRPSEQGGVTMPDIASGPYPHPYNAKRLVSWLPRPLELPLNEWERIAEELDIQTMEFVESATPHDDAKFLNRALTVLQDLREYHVGDGLGRFNASLRRSKRPGTSVFRGGETLPMIPTRTLKSHYIQFLNAEVAYVFTSRGPTLSSRKTLHLVHCIDKEWHWGKKLSEYLS